jgi:uncharacterized Zn-binding protein involved in type VI secretion
MGNVVRSGDTNTAGGAANGGAATVFAEGSNVGQPGMGVSPHPCCGSRGCGAHCAATTTGGSSTVFADGKPVLTTSDTDTCGHGRSSSAQTVFVGL